MPACASCGVERPASPSPCPRCGAPPAGVPELDLPIRQRPAPVSSRARKERQDISFDLAFDPRGAEPKSQPQEKQDHLAIELAESKPDAKLAAPAGGSFLAERPLSDAELLADYGPPPKHWLLSPFYALRVLTRQRALKRALVARSGEAERASSELEDALVALAERILPTVAQHPDYADSVGGFRRSEELLRVRDRVLAVENDAEMARLASADARLSKLETELASSQAGERTLSVELATAKQALEREEASLKKAESELRSAQRDLSGTRE